MAAPIGNTFYNLRLKHGRDFAIETPEELVANFIEYAQWTEANPLIEIDYKGKDAERVEIPKMRAMTKDGFALACGLSGWEIIKDWKERKGFSEVITRIEKYIFEHKFGGAAAGLLNANIISRDLGLSESVKNEVSLNQMPDWMQDDTK
jgi:hypothetical protein